MPFTTKPGAAVPLKATTVVPVRLVPVMVTPVPTGPLAGVKLAMAGAGTVTVKLPALWPLPMGVVTPITPVAAPVGTVTVIWVLEFTTKTLAAVPLNVTAVVPVKLVPVTTTLVPTGPLVGVNDVTVGGSSTVKLAALLPVPPAVVTLITPVVAPGGTVAVRVVPFTTAKVGAFTPLKRTAEVVPKSVPVSVTLVPTGPLVGVKLAMVGAGAVTVKLLLLTAVPLAVVRLTGPVLAPAGTVAVTLVADTPLNTVAATPLKRTAVTPPRLVPVMVTLVPTGPLVGAKEVMTGLTQLKKYTPASVIRMAWPRLGKVRSRRTARTPATAAGSGSTRRCGAAWLAASATGTEPAVLNEVPLSETSSVRVPLTAAPLGLRRLTWASDTVRVAAPKSACTVLLLKKLASPRPLNTASAAAAPRLPP